MLKKIEAIIREDKVNDVKDALSEIGIVGLNIFEIRGHGRQGGIKLSGRSGTYMVDMLPKIQVNIVLSDRNLEATIEAILRSAYTGEQGDGLIFVYPVEEVIRIRTRERSQEAMIIPVTSMKEKAGYVVLPPRNHPPENDREISRWLWGASGDPPADCRLSIQGIFEPISDKPVSSPLVNVKLIFI